MRRLCRLYQRQVGRRNFRQYAGSVDRVGCVCVGSKSCWHYHGQPGQVRMRRFRLCTDRLYRLRRLRTLYQSQVGSHLCSLYQWHFMRLLCKLHTGSLGRIGSVCLGSIIGRSKYVCVGNITVKDGSGLAVSHAGRKCLCREIHGHAGQVKRRLCRQYQCQVGTRRFKQYYGQTVEVR